MFGDTEIGEHQRRMGIGGNEQQVLGLEISVHNVLAVQVIDGLEDVLHGLSGILFGELAIIADSVEELASGSELGDNVELLLALEPVLEGDDVWVVALLEQRELFNYHVVVSLEVFLTMILTATSSPVECCFAYLTIPKVPAPRVLPNL